MTAEDLMAVLKTVNPKAKILFWNDSTYEDGVYSADSVSLSFDTSDEHKGYVVLQSEYKTEYSEVI